MQPSDDTTSIVGDDGRKFDDGIFVNPVTGEQSLVVAEAMPLPFTSLKYEPHDVGTRGKNIHLARALGYDPELDAVHKTEVEASGSDVVLPGNADEAIASTQRMEEQRRHWTRIHAALDVVHTGDAVESGERDTGTGRQDMYDGYNIIVPKLRPLPVTNRSTTQENSWFSFAQPLPLSLAGATPPPPRLKDGERSTIARPPTLSSLQINVDPQAVQPQTKQAARTERAGVALSQHSFPDVLNAPSLPPEVELSAHERMHLPMHLNAMLLPSNRPPLHAPVELLRYEKNGAAPKAGAGNVQGRNMGRLQGYTTRRSEATAAQPRAAAGDVQAERVARLPAETTRTETLSAATPPPGLVLGSASTSRIVGTVRQLGRRGTTESQSGHVARGARLTAIGGARVPNQAVRVAWAGTHSDTSKRSEYS